MTNPLKLNIPPKLKRGPKTKQWLGYLEKLRWTSDCQEESIRLAALRGASLGIAEDLFVCAVSQMISREGGKSESGALLVEFKKAYRYVQNYALGSFGLNEFPLRFTRKPEAAPESQASITVPIIPDIEQFLAGRSPCRVDAIDVEGFLEKLYGKLEVLLPLKEATGRGVLFGHPIRWKSYSLSGNDMIGGFKLLVNPIDPKYRQHLQSEIFASPEQYVGVHRYAVINYSSDCDAWRSLIAQVPLPVVAVYHASYGTETIVRIDAGDEADWARRVKSVRTWLVNLGADSKRLSTGHIASVPLMNPCSGESSLFYFAPDADGTPIVELPPRPASEDFIQRTESLLKPGRPIPLDEILKLREALMPLRDEPRVVRLLTTMDRLNLGVRR